MRGKKRRPVEIRIPTGVEFGATQIKIEQFDVFAAWDLATKRYVATGNGSWLIEALRGLYRLRQECQALDWPERELLLILENPPARLAAALSKPGSRRESVAKVKRDLEIRARYEAEQRCRPGMKKGAIRDEIEAEAGLPIGSESIKKIVLG